MYTLQDFENRPGAIFHSKYWNRNHLDEITNSLLKQLNAIQELQEKYKRRRKIVAVLENSVEILLLLKFIMCILEE